jgi:hypothetical protein
MVDDIPIGNEATKKPTEAARNTMSDMLHDRTCLWPHVLGQGWEKSKIHKQLHVPDDIEWNGVPQVSHMGPTEHNHIRLVKPHAQGMQQCMELLYRELGQLVSNMDIVDMVFQCMATQNDWPPPASSSLVQTMGLSKKGWKG